MHDNNNNKDFKHLPYRKCVGIVLLDNQQYIWRGRRRKEQSWQMPQGGIEPGESPRQASDREMEEETGISQKHIKFIDSMKKDLAYDLPVDILRNGALGGRYRGQCIRWFIYQFVGKEQDINLPEGGEFDAWDWVSASQMINDVVAFRKPMYEHVLQQYCSL